MIMATAANRISQPSEDAGCLIGCEIVDPLLNKITDEQAQSSIIKQIIYRICLTDKIVSFRSEVLQHASNTTNTSKGKGKGKGK